MQKVKANLYHVVHDESSSRLIINGLGTITVPVPVLESDSVELCFDKRNNLSHIQVNQQNITPKRIWKDPVLIGEKKLTKKTYMQAVAFA